MVKEKLQYLIEISYKGFISVEYDFDRPKVNRRNTCLFTFSIYCLYPDSIQDTA